MAVCNVSPYATIPSGFILSFIIILFPKKDFKIPFIFGIFIEPQDSKISIIFFLVNLSSFKTFSIGEINSLDLFLHSKSFFLLVILNFDALKFAQKKF